MFSLTQMIGLLMPSEKRGIFQERKSNFNASLCPDADLIAHSNQHGATFTFRHFKRGVVHVPCKDRSTNYLRKSLLMK
jgi:hypothetical protein